jgi:NADH-quinone oxidoreductase subunit J
MLIPQKIKGRESKIKNLILIMFHLAIFLGIAYSVWGVIWLIIVPILFESVYFLWLPWFYIIIPWTILISSLLVILLPNPIYALISLIVVFLNTAIFLLSIQVQFLAFIYLIVYIGAIAILFLFVIMLFNLRNLRQSDMKIQDFNFLKISFNVYLVFAIKFILIISYDISLLMEYSSYINHTIIYKSFDLQHYLTYVDTDILLFANLFYTYYLYIFLLAGLVLLSAMIGSIVLALSTTEIEPTMLEKKIYKLGLLDNPELLEKLDL